MSIGFWEEFGRPRPRHGQQQPEHAAAKAKRCTRKKKKKKNIKGEEIVEAKKEALGLVYRKRSNSCIYGNC